LAGEILFEAKDNGIYLVRIQPEMLINISYQLAIYKTASLAFPVQGKDRKAIMSFFGAPRDGGRRKHKGVDIFADKGTPILAATDGRVTLRNGGLGGKTVWQRQDGMSLYYAHMDSQYVRSGQQVKAGETLGTVGNTGNARHTPSHLHFGIYRRSRGAVDPLAFIDTNGKKPESATFSNKKGKWGRIKNPINLRNRPDSKAPAWEQLEKDAPLFVKADCSEWLWVENSKGKNGFIRSQAFTEIHQPLRTKVASKQQPVHLQPDTCSAISHWIQAGEEVAIFAENQDFYLVKKSGKNRWIQKPGGS
jgi:SH3-like domain-containing protein